MHIHASSKWSRNYIQHLVVVLSAVLLVFAVGGMVKTNPVAATAPCPCNLFDTGTPATDPAFYDDGTPVTLGVHFKPQVDGYITGVRMYKEAGMTDTYTGKLWAPDHSLLATGTFSGSVASGWEDLTFSTPVHVTAGSMYTASYYSPTGKYVATSLYYSSAVDNYPLLAPDSSSASSAGFNGNGVFIGSDAYPNSSASSANYWVDVTFQQTIDNSTPQVTAVTPAASASSVEPGMNITATFNQNLLSSSVSSSTVMLKDPANNTVASTVSYDDATKTITLDPTATLAENTTYTASLEGGVSGISNLDGARLTSTYTWSFKTGTDSCPCSVWSKDAALTNTPKAFTGTGGETLGATVHAIEAGYLHAVRFYKSLTDTSSTHTVKVWTTGGTLLGSGTSSNESSSGWQEVALSAPIAVTADTNYVVSYYSPANTHVYSTGGLLSEVGTGVMRANANGASYASGDAFPATPSSPAGDNYWVDAVFSLSSTYTEPFKVEVTQPLANAFGVQTATPITLQLSNPVDATTVAGAVSVKDAANNAVAGTASYDSSNQMITFTPASALSVQTKYTVTVASTLKDVYGTSLGSAYSFSFTTGTALATDINQGLGGPVLVLTDSANPYDAYLAEILRAEGITYFTVKDISNISLSTLSQYKLALLGKSTLSTDQVSTLESWVTAGGNLITMQPDKKLASFLGLTDKSSTLSEGYLKVDTSQAPGKGIEGATMQYHGSADLYQNDSAQTVATLYSNATTSASDPAVVQKTVGSGHVAAFTYDLPHSIVALHQGNIAWAGTDRDGSPPIRPNDLFYGGASTDYVNLSKAYIPQADEQQRLLVNMMQDMSKHSSPMPRFWILPHGYKGAVVMAGDDHSTTSGTYDVADELLLNSNRDCSVADWQCARAQSFAYTTSGLTSAQANQIYALGFDTAVHTSTNCNDATYSSIVSAYTSDLSGFQAKYTGLPLQHTDRTHCYVWPDWDSIAKVDALDNLHYNMNYEWYPPAWTGSNTGYLTGSGLSMRLTDASGNLLNVLQGVTDLDYETDATTTSMNADFGNVVGSSGFYGFLGTHYDFTTDYQTELIAAARAHNLPMITAEQVVTWKNALESSSFSNITSTSSKLDFTVKVAQGGSGMQAMVPASTDNGSITGLTDGSTNVSYTTSTVKGVTYAVFSAAPGTYSVQYGTAPSSPSGTPTSTASSSAPSSTSTTTGSSTSANSSDTQLATITNSTPESTNATSGNDTKNLTVQDSTKNKSIAGLLAAILIPVGIVLVVVLFARFRKGPNQQL